MKNELGKFIDHARSKGMDHATIRMLLLSNDWKEKDVVEALAQTTLDLPIPVPPDKGGAREAFFHLLMTAAYYTSMIGVVMLVFQGINRLLPDPIVPQRFWEKSTIRWYLALLLVCFPSFLWLSRLNLRELHADPEKASSGTRRWLIYMTLFLATLALVGDLITMLYRLLEGELSTRFLVKTAAIFVLAGLSFAYFRLSLSQAAGLRRTRRLQRGFAAVAILVVSGVVAGGFLMAGSPGTERARKIDERRIGDLSQIRDEIMEQCLGRSRYETADRRKLVRPLPKTLAVVAAQANDRRPTIEDPESGKVYAYEILNSTRFRIGAQFETVRDERQRAAWNHGVGWTWFEFDLMEE